jgi:hypothetical protein
MLLAVSAMLLQILATPLPIDSADAVAITAAAASGTAPAESAAKGTEASSEEAASPAEYSVVDAELGSSVTYAPGSLVRGPVAPATPGESSSSATSLSPLLFNSDALEKQHGWEQRQKKIWRALTIAQSSAATFDAWSTRRGIAGGKQYELNPMLRPFARNDSMYAAIQIGPLLLDYIGRRMLTSRHGWAQHTWWIPQAVGTAMSLASGARNLAVYRAP